MQFGGSTPKSVGRDILKKLFFLHMSDLSIFTKEECFYLMSSKTLENVETKCFPYSIMALFILTVFLREGFQSFPRNPAHRCIEFGFVFWSLGHHSLTIFKNNPISKEMGLLLFLQLKIIIEELASSIREIDYGTC